MERERAMNMIRGAVMAMHVPTATKTELFEVIDALAPPCPKCNVEMVAETMVCRDCGPTA